MGVYSLIPALRDNRSVSQDGRVDHPLKRVEEHCNNVKPDTCRQKGGAASHADEKLKKKSTMINSKIQHVTTQKVNMSRSEPEVRKSWRTQSELHTRHPENPVQHLGQGKHNKGEERGRASPDVAATKNHLGTLKLRRAETH